MGAKDFQITVIRPDGNYNLNDYDSWFVSQVSGISIPPNNRFVERAALQHGATNRGFRLLPRYFDFILRTVDTSEQTYWENRETVGRIFAPSSDLFSIKFTMGTLSRQIDCSTRGIVTGKSTDRAGYGQKWGVQFVAPDPLFYNPTRVSSIIGGWGSSGFTIPMTVPFDFGTSTVDQTNVLSNAGSWETYPEIQIVGPIVNPVITNLSTGYKLDFTGTTIALNEERVINTDFAVKSVVDELGANKISDLTTDSDLTSFSLVIGNNSIHLAGTGVTSATQIIFRYYLKYIAI